MKKEILARALLFSFLFVAVAVPLGGQWLSTRSRPGVLELHARMPENGGWSLDTIQAQVGQPLRLRLTSDDVVHSFALGRSSEPALEILPGEFVETTLTFDQPGKYTFYCSRWCGPNHWRMRGVIEVSGPGQPVPADPQPLFLKLGIDPDAPQDAQILPASAPSDERGAQFADRLPTYALSRETYLTHSPEQLWLRLRADDSLSGLGDNDLWDVVAWAWQRQASPAALAEGQKLYAANCAACHGETGKGDGVMVRGLPRWDPTVRQSGGAARPPTGEGLASPPDFSDPRHLLGASPALLEGKTIRGGRGTGMPYWGPVLTPQQMDAVLSYMYRFAWESLK